MHVYWPASCKVRHGWRTRLDDSVISLLVELSTAIRDSGKLHINDTRVKSTILIIVEDEYANSFQMQKAVASSLPLDGPWPPGPNIYEPLLQAPLISRLPNTLARAYGGDTWDIQTGPDSTSLRPEPQPHALHTVQHFSFWPFAGRMTLTTYGNIKRWDTKNALPVTERCPCEGTRKKEEGSSTP